jgi:hypothetical protein
MASTGQAVENAWRRVPESNRSTRICNPSEGVEPKQICGKHPRFVHDEQSKGCAASVNSAHAESEVTATLSDARSWAASATLDGLRAFALAAYEAMPPDTARSFADFVHRDQKDRQFGDIFTAAAIEYRAERDRRGVA